VTDPERTIVTPPPVMDADRTVPSPPPVPDPVFAATRTIGHDDAPTVEIPTKRRGGADAHAAPPGRLAEVREIGRAFLKRHEKKIWWLHTCYALGLGAFVATFAQKGFERARMLTLTLPLAWLLVVFFFRFFGTGARQDFMTAWPGARRRFFIMSYLMKNLFQGMLFYLLPFYWRSSSFDTKTATMLCLLGGCAILSTLDLVFDRVLLRFKLIASAFFAITLFGSTNLVVPVLLPDTPSVVTLCVSAGLSAATFMLFHLPFSSLLRPLGAGAFVVLVGGGVSSAYLFRRAMPPVPIYVREGGVGPALRDDGTLTIEARVLREGSFQDVYAVTDVAVLGKNESFRHVWRLGKKELSHETASARASTAKNVVRVASKLPESSLKAAGPGHYTVDVETDGGQIVGRVAFDIEP
jgi:hypothetical protein